MRGLGLGHWHWHWHWHWHDNGMWRASWFALIAISLSLASPLALAQDDPTPPLPEGADDATRMSFASAVPVDVFIKAVAAQTHAIYMYDPAQIENKRVYILGRDVRVPKKAYGNLLGALLKQIGFTITSYGENRDDNVKIFQIIPIDQAGRQIHRGAGSPAPGQSFGQFVDERLRERAQFMTMIVHLDYADPSSVQRALLNLTTRPGGVVQPITGVNAVLISDFEYQIKRMAMLLDILDRPGPQVEVSVIPVQWADASELVQTIGDLLRARSQGGGRGRTRTLEQDVVLQADQRSNAIIAQALPDKIKAVRQLVHKLDIEIPEEVKGRIHIYFCKHAQATDLEQTLSSLIGSDSFTQPGQQRPGQPRQPQQQPRFRPRVDNNDQERPSVVADEQSNSLIITATAETYLEIRQILDQLDVRRPQVMIETAIVEIVQDRGLDFGIELAAVDPPPNGQRRPFTGTAFGLSDLVDEAGEPLVDGLGTPVGRNPTIGPGIVAGLMDGSAFRIPILIKALATTSDTNVLSRPLVLTNDNQEATIDIVDTVAFPVTQTVASGVTTGGFQYAEAPIRLTITPHISADDYLTLEIDQRVETFTAGPGADGTPPPTSRRDIRGTITVPNGETVVIGGLTTSTTTKVVRKVPILGDIPILGQLFRSTSIQERRGTLYMFVRPVILRAPDFSDLKKISNDAVDRVEAMLLDSASKDLFLEAARGDRERFDLEREGRPRRTRDYRSLRDPED